jgi:hypothetical protein
VEREFVVEAISPPRQRLASWSDLTAARKTGMITASIFVTFFYTYSTHPGSVWDALVVCACRSGSAPPCATGGAAILSALAPSRVSGGLITIHL